MRTTHGFPRTLALALSAGFALQALTPTRNAAELQLVLDKLQVLGSVLYIAPHPDDESTPALTHFSKGRKLRTGYLSLTRGGGGQDLIGPELDDALAAIRTQELLAARQVDGAEQFFSRAVDFGYSKTTEETLAVWGKDAILADMVWTIRRFRPDVIITRFTPLLGGHGHHTASAVLALEAFQAAADPTRFPEQLGFVKPWQATRIAWNAFRPEGQAPLNDVLAVDVGAYDPLLGKSYAELAAESRSMHRSQGFGAVAFRGSRQELFQVTGGRPATRDLFDGIDTTWGRIPGARAVGEKLAEARRAFRPEKPTLALPHLLQALTALDKLPAEPWLEVKRLELLDAIRCAAGLWTEALADRQSVAPREPFTVAATVIARGEAPVKLRGVALLPGTDSRVKETMLPANQPLKETFHVTLPAGTACTQPYWLGSRQRTGLHPAGPIEVAGLPEAPPPLNVLFRLEADGIPFEFSTPVQFRFRDPVLGERNQPLAVTPEVMVHLADRVLVLGGAAPRELQMSVVAGRAQASGTLRVRMPEGWRADPAELPFSLARSGDEVKLRTRITPTVRPSVGELRLEAGLEGRWEPARDRERIDYPHIPLQTLFPMATARLVKLDLKHNGRRLGYIMGAGDDIPQCLRPLGYDVDLLTDEALAGASLAGYDAIVVGIRAYNTRPRLTQLNARLLDYVAQGGTLLVQYNVNGAFPGTNAGLTTNAIGPFPFRIGRDRVTVEAAPVTFLTPSHPVLNVPNRITADDFQGWVQERGLYFAESWDPRYVPVFAMNDPGEKPLEGSLLIAPHGKGHFVYTGLAFFRQLPDGVPGAYRLFANLLALGSRHD